MFKLYNFNIKSRSNNIDMIFLKPTKINNHQKLWMKTVIATLQNLGTMVDG